jgi:hypothetical protein
MSGDWERNLAQLQRDQEDDLRRRAQHERDVALMVLQARIKMQRDTLDALVAASYRAAVMIDPNHPLRGAIYA